MKLCKYAVYNKCMYMAKDYDDVVYVYHIICPV